LRLHLRGRRLPSAKRRPRRFHRPCEASAIHGPTSSSTPHVRAVPGKSVNVRFPCSPYCRAWYWASIARDVTPIQSIGSARQNRFWPVPWHSKAHVNPGFWILRASGRCWTRV